MSSAANIIAAVGISPEAAKAIGEIVSVNQAGAGTASVGATLLAGSVNSLTTTGGQTAFRMPSQNAGKSLECYNLSSTSALIFPPTGGTINGGSTDASISLAQNKGVLLRYLTPLTVVTVTGA